MAQDAARCFVERALAAGTGPPQCLAAVSTADTSASMRATDVGPDRLTWAKEQAHRLADDLRPYEQMAVLTAGGPARVACGWSHDRQALHRAIDKTEPTDAADSMADAIDLTRWMLAQQTNPKIVVITDGCFADAASLSSGADIQFITPDAPGSAAARRPPVNYAITALAARVAPILGDESDRRLIDQLYVEVSNFSDRDAAIPLTIEAPRQSTVELTVAVGAGRTSQRFVDLNQNVRGLVTVRIKVQDDLAADNEAWLTISRPLAGKGNKKAVLLMGRTTSDVIGIDPAGTARQLVTASPASHSWSIGSRQDRVGPLLWVGPWQIAPTAGGASSDNPDAPGFVAVNLLNREESDLRPRANPKSSPLPLATAARRDPPGAWLLLGALVLCGGEWLLFQRRLTV
ncbi:MAG: VWA domain-containing protein [Planctomycetia bacterium]|nr:VWA domain-containing protein [Planctomycetia bacterium]